MRKNLPEILKARSIKPFENPDNQRPSQSVQIATLSLTGLLRWNAELKIRRVRQDVQTIQTDIWRGFQK